MPVIHANNEKLRHKMSDIENTIQLIELGWREWISLPHLGINKLLAKVDTGAKTCALHSFYVDPFQKDGESWLRFGLHPFRKSTKRVIHCQARQKDYREVRDSGGKVEKRYVIETDIILGLRVFQCEMTLTNRDSMRYRFLLGRNALKPDYLVNSARSCTMGKPDVSILPFANDAGELKKLNAAPD
jgi:hypothetical protein